MEQNENVRVLQPEVKPKPFSAFRLIPLGGAAVKRIVQTVAYILAVIYFLVDAVFVGLTRPISKWLAKHFEMRRLRDWIRSLPPYPSLALFSVPVILLEPIKPLAAYMATTGQLIGAALTFVTGEVLKLVLVERLFCLTRDKLMRIPAFAWAHGHYTRIKAWLTATEAWQRVQSLRRAALDHLQNWRDIAYRRFALNHRR